MMRRSLVLLTLVVAPFGASTGNPVVEKACSVACPKPPVCREFWETPIIFVGRVTAMAVESEGDQYWIRVRFAITETFRGNDAKDIELVLTDSTCNPNFDIGQSWLVYATNRAGRTGSTTSDCSRTRLLSQAAEDLAYLRLPDSEKGSSRIIGRVFRERFRLEGQSVARDAQPVRGVRVTARGDRKTFETTTDGDGRYQLPADPFDSYVMSFEPPPGLRLPGQPLDRVSVSHHRACAEVDVLVRDDGRVRGRVLDARRKPVPNFPLSLRLSPLGSYGGLDSHVRTGADGRFEFHSVMPARYMLAPSSSLWGQDRTVAPLRAELIDVGIAQRTGVGDVALPAGLRTVPLTVREGFSRWRTSRFLQGSRPRCIFDLRPRAKTF